MAGGIGAVGFNFNGASMKYLIGCICAACALGLAGCNTMEGLGTDISKGGEKIQTTAQNVRRSWHQASVRNERAYDQARATCAGLSGTDHDACMDRARERYTTSMNEARRQYPAKSMSTESEEDRMEDGTRTTCMRNHDAPCYTRRGHAVATGAR
jgi:predicted small secreted protein